jgi:hypothetical protein
MFLWEENKAVASPSLLVVKWNEYPGFVLTRKELGRGMVRGLQANVSSNVTGIFYCTNHAYSLLS